MSNVVEALVEGIVDELLSTIRKLPKRKAEIPKEIEKWSPILADLSSVVGDAENKKSSDFAIECWIHDLEDICLDVEDVLAELQYDMMHSQKRSCGDAQVPNFLVPFFKILKAQPKAVVELQNLTARLNRMMEKKNRLGLLKENAIIPRQRVIRDPSESVRNYTKEKVIKLYGREAEKKKIMNFLRHENDKIDVLAIVGGGGIGKTTLLHHIFNDDEVVCSFQVRTWVCISQDAKLRDIFKSMIETITNQVCDLPDLSCKVRDEVKDKKFCIVLDDLWSIDILYWKQLLAPLMGGAPGSKVLVTTRNVNIAHLVTTVDEHIVLHYLSKNDWLDLFCSHLKFDVRRNSNSKLKKIGEDLARKCGGLPLAATIIGSLLCRNHDEDDWSAMLNNMSETSREGQLQIDSVLKMSYNDLPYSLKHCFLFCTIFPDDHQFREHDLVQLWTAASLIESDKRDVGHSFFQELVSRSLLMSVENYYVMHDLIRDMGRHVSHTRYCRWENALGSWKSIRHLSIPKSMIGEFIKDLIQREEKTFALRTLIIEGGEYNIEQIDADSLFTKLPKLRVLHARGLPVRNLSIFISQMKHLAYLNVWECKEADGAMLGAGELGQSAAPELVWVRGALMGRPLEQLGHLSDCNIVG